ncbi:MAG: type II toxin-antitoxin system Phd/YefM family antitoxin [Acidimicrobiia bacterium]|nr:type II toxin-antitoxin system Phd/YefM family antitoxin [Acidimicrobiia bacterium]MYB24946.1 type II toxin-antitoxin system Phd/YefM family antitoxin [Acidimicrobiia bacterium]MYE68395.1 type II toxin-antitoxin system Phd/YefM family antitoxin [Acidimicrobiia bacterium]
MGVCATAWRERRSGRARPHRILVTRNGRPSFVILNPDDLESLEATIEILSDDELMDSLRKSRSEAADGQLTPLGDLL